MKTEERNLIIGFGMTGQSVADYYAAQGAAYWIADDSVTLADKDELRAEYQAADICQLNELKILPTDTLMVSPGVPVRHQQIQAALKIGATVSNDVQLFSELCDKPLALITGSNGKSTVTELVGQLLEHANVQAGVGGNIGVPALSLLNSESDVYVLEVSSYQLELADHAKTKVAVLLNLSPDHLDRYESLDHYYQAKLNIFNEAEVAIVNREIEYELNIPGLTRVISIGFGVPAENDYGIVEDNGIQFIARGSQQLVCETDLRLSGQHNLLNVMAALAVCIELGADQASLVAAVPALKGLAHRFETVSHESKHLVINDSKSTNPASTLAAIQSVNSDSRPLELILGGLAKDADFSVLDEAIQHRVHRCVVYGTDRFLIAKQLTCPVDLAETLDDCLEMIDSSTPKVILFSPACASQDQFANFSQRGDYFKSKVAERFL